MTLSGEDLELSAEAIVRVVGRCHILREVTVSVRAGESVALLGRNGAGKTTLLSILAGRVVPEKGRVRITAGGRDLTGPERRSRIGLLPHDLLVYPDLTARENLDFFAALHGIVDAKRRIAEVLEEVGLARDADRTLRTYSRGMQQRAALGRLMVSGAPIWLLDEPTTGLDESGRRWIQDLLVSHSRAGGIVLFSTHHASEVASVATRTWLLDSGRLVLDAAGGPDGAARAFARMDGGVA